MTTTALPYLSRVVADAQAATAAWARRPSTPVGPAADGDRGATAFDGGLGAWPDARPDTNPAAGPHTGTGRAGGRSAAGATTNASAPSQGLHRHTDQPTVQPNHQPPQQTGRTATNTLQTARPGVDHHPAIATDRIDPIDPSNSVPGQQPSLRPAADVAARPARSQPANHPDSNAPLEAQTLPWQPPGIEPARRASAGPSRPPEDDPETSSPDRPPVRQGLGDALAPELPTLWRQPVKPVDGNVRCVGRTDVSTSTGTEASPSPTAAGRPAAAAATTTAPAASARATAPPADPPPHAAVTGVAVGGRRPTPGGSTPDVAAWPAPSEAAQYPAHNPAHHAAANAARPAPRTRPTPWPPHDPGPRVVIGTIDIAVLRAAPAASQAGLDAKAAGRPDFSAATDPGRRYVRRW